VPRPRFYRVDPGKRSELLHVAAVEVARSGLDGASMNRIIERSGLSKGALYYYFDDRDDLLATVFGELFHGMCTACGLGAPETDDVWVELRRSMERADAYAYEDPEAARLGRRLMETLVREGSSWPVLAPLLEDARELARAPLRRGRELGLVRSDVPLDLLVELSMAVRLAVQTSGPGLSEATSPEELARATALQLDLLHRLLRT